MNSNENHSGYRLSVVPEPPDNIRKVRGRNGETWLKKPLHCIPFDLLTCGRLR